MLYLLAREEPHLGGQNAAAAFKHLAAALAAGALATACRREVYALLGKGGNEAVACAYGEFFVAVDGYGDVALWHQPCSQKEQQDDQQGNDYQKYYDG